MKKTSKSKNGFTLIELLMVITILAIMSAFSVVVLNQKRHVGAARNVRRDLDVQTFALGLYSYTLDNNGNFPAGLLDTPTYLCRFESTNCAGLLDVHYLYGKYITMPLFDPLEEDENSTGYTAELTSDGHILVIAPLAENNQPVSALR